MNNTDITLQGPIATWHMKRLDGDLGGSYSGTFTFRCFLSPTAQLEAGRKYRSLLGDLGHASTDTEGNLAFALTQLEQRIIKAPPFWTSTAQDSGIAGNIGDLNVIIEVLNAALKAEDLFKAGIAKEREALLNNSIKAAEDLQKRGAE